MSEYLFKSAYKIAASIKDMDAKKGIVTGYAAHFGSIDADGDIIMPGAFNKSVKEQGPESTQPRIKHLLNHKKDQPLGNPIILKEDATGLYYESQVGSHALGQDFLKMVESNLITEHSIGFATVRSSQSKEMDANLLHELKLWEFSSLTAWGANQNTPLMGMKDAKSVETRIGNLIKALSNGTFTDNTFSFLADELLYLQKAFKDIQTTTPPKGTLPGDYLKAMQTFTNTLKQK